jgi:aerobic-type carbon monoxide dehydrogenase small subunit (CoxS/CutS family)
MSTERHAIKLTVNGRAVEAEVEPRLLLVDFIRHHLRLTGSHVGCAHGVCGACTIIADGRTARSCLMFAVQADGMQLRTVESLAGDGALSPLQVEFHRHHALQCGYCTPGMLMSATALLAETAEPTEAAIRTALSGNLCRCTGYVNIVQAVKATAERLAASGNPGAAASLARAEGGKQ